MPEHPIFEAVEHDVLRAAHMAGDWFHPHRRATQTPAAQPVTLALTTTTEEPMSLAADLHALAARLEPLGEEAVTKLELVAANPATAEAFDLLHKITGIGVDPSIVSLAVGGLKALVQAYAPAQPAEAPVAA